MFGTTQVRQIAEGWINDITKREQELYDYRMPICQSCPLYVDDPIFHGKCDNKKFYNPETGEMSIYPRTGFINGCGCAMRKKVRVKDAKCALNRW